MYHDKKILAIIPARGGSRSIPKKNIALLAGQPMICFSIDQARQSQYLDKIIVTSEDDEILAIAKGCGAECIKRPKELAGDASKIDEAVNHALDALKEQGYIPDFIVLLQPTSPLRKASTIDRAIELFIKNSGEFDSLMPLAPASNKIGSIVGNVFIPKYQPGVQRQELEKIYYDCGTIHIFKPELIKQGKFFGEKLYAFEIGWPESLDIDSPDDLILAEFYLQQYAH